MRLLIFIVVILLSICALLRLVQSIDAGRYDAPNRTADGSLLDGILSSGSQSELGKRDCNVELLYAMEDDQCRSVCREPGLFRAKNGACVNVLAFEKREAVKNKCDAARGVLAYLVGNTQFGNTSLLCLSVDLGVQPDDPKSKNTICGYDGKIDIDYLKEFPRVADCKCPDNKVLTVIPSTSNIRMRGLCVNANLARPFSYNQLVYSPNDETV